MIKDFETWGRLKQQKDSIPDEQIVYFEEREIWWHSGGVNIGTEIDGKNEEFSRPVFILRKFNRYGFLGVPLSTTRKSNKYKVPISFLQGKRSVALISQVRALDSRRLLKKMGILSHQEALKIKEAIKALL